MSKSNFKIAAAMALVFAAAAAWAADSGKFEMKYTENQPIPVGDAEGHAIYLGNASGPAIGGSIDGAKVSTREFVDIVNGNGNGRGYTTLSKGGDSAIYKHEGAVKTTMTDKGQPNTTFQGRAVNVKAGLGKKLGEKVDYTGYFTSPTDYVLEWRKVE